MNRPILQNRLPDPPWLDPKRWRLPGIQPLSPQDWLIRDEVFAEQMALRDALIASRQSEVHALLPSAHEAAVECCELVIQALKADEAYVWSDGAVTRPDGITVALDSEEPLLTVGRLTQSDMCLLESGPDGHILTGAILCFPAYWTLAEKIGKAMPRIHEPVPEYNDDVGRRVQRLFDAVHPEQLLCRANANLHVSPDLFTPKGENEPERRVPRGKARFVRSERQAIRKLPRTGATVFSIHTYMVPLDRLDQRALDALDRLAPYS